MSDLWPNFFLVGAARSGTTALVHMLRQHPDVFVPHQKEPHYFALGEEPPSFGGPDSEHGINRKAVWRTDDYLRLFDKAGGRPVRGEGSASYLYFPGVAERIRDRLGQVKILAALRDPTQRAFSNYQYLRSVAREYLPTFAAALDAEVLRVREGWEHIWFYRGLGRYERQLRRYEEVFGRENLHVVLHEELRADPAPVLRGIFRFLGVDPRIDLSTDFEVNVSGEPVSGGVARLLFRPSWLIRGVRPFVPRSLRVPLETAARNVLLRRRSIPAEAEAVLRAEYEPEIRSLERFLGRDLSGWHHPA